MKRCFGAFGLMLVCHGLIGLAHSAFAAEPAATPPVKVTFVNPEKFTDATLERRGTAQDRSDVLRDLEKFMVKTATRQLRSGQRLELEIMDVDLAGGFEPTPRLSELQVRIVRDVYPPRMSLNFRLFDAAGAVVSEGKRDLTNPSFLTHAYVNIRSEPLRFDKQLFQDWIRKELRARKKSKS